MLKKIEALRSTDKQLSSWCIQFGYLDEAEITDDENDEDDDDATDKPDPKNERKPKDRKVKKSKEISQPRMHVFTFRFELTRDRSQECEECVMAGTINDTSLRIGANIRSLIAQTNTQPSPNPTKTK